MRFLLLSPLFLLACSDYDLTTVGDEPPAPGDDTDNPYDDTDGWDDECENPTLDPGTVAVDESCETQVEVGSWTPVIEWRSTVPGDTYTTPVVGQLTDDNGDGRIDDLDMPDIVVANASGQLFALSGDGSGVHWTTGNLGAEPSTAAIGDLDGDGRPEVVGSGSGGIIAVRGDTGAPFWSTSIGASTKLICGGVAIYDLEGDGKVEVVQGALALNGEDGSMQTIGSKGWGTGYTSGTYASFGVAADTNQDGVLEIVTGNAAYGPKGDIVWQNTFSDGFVAVGNFDSDPYGEVVVTWYPGLVRLQDHDGSLIWSGSYTGNTIGPPTVADFDGDGAPEIGVAGNGIYVMLDGDGTQIWARSVNDYSSGFTGSSVFDFEGDGKAEVVFADENDLWVFDGATGSVKLQESAHSSATCSEYPAIADVDNDGHAEIIYSSGVYSGTETGVTVVGDADDTWQPARTIWNQHAYHITNVASSAGAIPAVMATNWLTHNTFRSGDLSAATGGVYSDAIPLLAGICTDECDDGRLEVVVQVGNAGISDLPAGVPYTLYAADGDVWTSLRTGTTGEAVLSGTTTPSIVFDLDADEVGVDGLIFVVDDQDGVQLFAECHEDNNVLVLDQGLCDG